MGFNLPVLNRRRRPGGFSPVFLFSSGSQGVWYEPSDLTTMFQDRAGTTPVTTPGQTVGKRLDKSGRGNHAVAPTDAARPTYGIEPWSGRRNLLTRTEEFGDAVWDKGTGGSISTNSAVAPNGTTTADVYTWASTTSSFAHLSQTVSGQNPAQNFTFSIWIKRPAGSGSRILRLIISDVTTSTGESVQTTVTESWQRFSFTRASATNTGSIGVGLSRGGSGTIATGDLLEVWGAQLETSSTATAYQRVGTAFDVTEAGVPTVHYVQYDGTDDSFSTSSINFTATDKMSVFAGVRKLSDAARGTVVEIGGGGANGSFAMEAPDTNGTATFAFRSIGTSAATANFGANAAPITKVVTGLGDIAAPSSILRLNGSQVSQNTNTQGTGNFGNYPLFIGRRNNTSLPLNGRDYGIIIVGKTASATEIAATEAWLAARTSGVTL